MSLTFIGPVAEQGGPAIKNALTLKYLGASDIQHLYFGTVTESCVDGVLPG